MKLFLITSTVILWANILFAQEYQYQLFPTKNSEWSEYYTLYEEIESYNKLVLFDQDTLINGIVYHKLFLSHSAVATLENSVCLGAIREDSTRKVYFYKFDTDYPYTFMPKLLYSRNEIVLYDFGVSVGDTIQDEVEDFIDWRLMHVSDVDTLLYGNALRKVFYFSGIKRLFWIEGIGGAFGLLFNLYYNNLVVSNNLICVHQNGNLIYSDFNTFDECIPQFVKDDVPILPNTEISVFPNPVTNSKICFDHFNFETLQFYTLEGKLVQTINIENQNSFECDVSGFEKGIYIYKLSSKGLLPVKGKITIE